MLGIARITIRGWFAASPRVVILSVSWMHSLCESHSAWGTESHCRWSLDEQELHFGGYEPLYHAFSELS